MEIEFSEASEVTYPRIRINVHFWGDSISLI